MYRKQKVTARSVRLRKLVSQVGSVRRTTEDEKKSLENHRYSQFKFNSGNLKHHLRRETTKTSCTGRDKLYRGEQGKNVKHSHLLGKHRKREN